MSGFASPPGKGKDPASTPVAAAKAHATVGMTQGPKPTERLTPSRKRKRRSIARRITRMAMAVSLAGLVFAGVVFFACDIYAHYAHVRESTATLGRVTAENVRTPLDLGYVRTAADTLDAITAQPDITGAAVYRANGEPFARSIRAEASLPARLTGNEEGTVREWPYLRHFVPVMQKGARLGTVVIECTLTPLYRRLGVYGIIVAITLALGGITARLLAGRLQPAISSPIVELASVAEAVAKRRDYSIRAAKRAEEDEVGNLVDAFNRMLQEIERRDDEIDQARSNLEANVRARTNELHQQVENRKQAQAALVDSERRYRNLFENNPMPMFVVDVESLKFIAVNNAAMRHYGYNEPEFLRLSLTTITLADPVELIRAMRSTERTLDAGEWKHRKRGGEVIEVHITAHAIVLAKLAKIVLAQDVTQRNRARREVEELHKQLVEASRQAGMAEIATGVLHNVGNVLNSVNVSAIVIADGTRETKAGNIRKVAELLNQHEENLPALFEEGGKGRKLPQFLNALAEQLEQEQAARLSELELLLKNVEHIKQIVLTQQDYAKVTGVISHHEPRKLLEDALTMTDLEFDQEQIHVEIDVEAGVPEVKADRHKVLQILLNLFSNARHAMNATPERNRKLSIRIAREGPRVGIAVTDTGCGILQENLTRIFNHGFTTKLSGHGFGLHTAANAAGEMDGSLHAASEGEGKGATFTLSLPAGPERPPAKQPKLRK